MSRFQVFGFSGFRVQALRLPLNPETQPWGFRVSVSVFTCLGLRGGLQVLQLRARAKRLLSLMGGCQNYGPFLDPYYNTGPNTGPILGDPKRDHNFDKPPNGCLRLGLGFRLGYLARTFNLPFSQDLKHKPRTLSPNA